MLLFYSYCLGTRRQWWMPFRTPFATAGEQFVENTISSTIKLREIFLYTVTILNASPLTTRIIIAFFHVLISPCKNHESKYSHCKNIPTAKSAFHIPHQIKIKVSIYITRDQTVALWQHLGPSHFHVCHRIAILFTALKHITIVHFVFLSITFEYFLFLLFYALFYPKHYYESRLAQGLPNEFLTTS